MHPTLTVLLYSTIAAGMAGLGVLPLLAHDRVPGAWIGWAYALASGGMLGAAYLLSTVDSGSPPATAAGAAVGVLFILFTHLATGASLIDLHRPGHYEPGDGYRIALTDTLHSASEGIGIGVAMAVDLRFGIFVALVMGAHNIPEATVLGAVVRDRPARLRTVTGLALAVNITQVLLAVTTFAVLGAAPAALVWLQGFAVGALLTLVFVEMLPDAYRGAGATGIALVASVALSLVVLLGGAIR